MTSEPDWKLAWQPVQAQVGKQLVGPPPTLAAGPVEAEAIRRYLEPLELDCALHYDAAVARSYGHPNIIAPYTSVTSFALGPLWQPGEPLFESAARDSQQTHTNVRPFVPEGAPDVSGYFATNVDVDFVRPITVGDRLTRNNPVLITCEPKETRVGRGAFLTLQSDIIDEAGGVVAQLRSTVYFYEPWPHVPA